MEISGLLDTLSGVGWIEALGWTGALLTLLAYSMRTILAFRIVAFVSNIFFLCYGIFAEIYPTLVLHVALILLNGARLAQVLADVRRSRGRTSEVDWQSVLAPLARKTEVAAGTRLFAKGDPPENVYLILSGQVHLDEIGKDLGPGHLVGEIGFFTEARERTLTATCRTDCRFLAADEATFVKAYYQSPQIGLALLRTIAGRLAEQQVLLNRQ